MKWQRKKSDSFEDRRGMSTKSKAIAGGGILGIVILLLNAFGGENAQMITPILEQMNQGQQTEQVQERQLTAEEIQLGEFAEAVFVYNNETWQKIYSENNIGKYEEPGMVLFSGSVQTACGGASSASGPFYCPADQKVYMDGVINFIKSVDQGKTK